MWRAANPIMICSSTRAPASISASTAPRLPASGSEDERRRPREELGRSPLNRGGAWDGDLVVRARHV